MNAGLLDIKKMLKTLPEGEQKIYFEDVIRNIEKGEVVNPLDFIKGMETEVFDNVDIESLKEKEQKANKIYQEWAKR